MKTMEISEAVFYLMCSVILILVILLALFVTIVLKMSSRAYKLLGERRDDANDKNQQCSKYNIRFQKRKADTEDILCDYTDFTFDHPEMQTKTTVVKPYTIYENNPNEKDAKIITQDKKEVPQKSETKAAVALPPLILRQKMEEICAELIQAQKSLGKNANNESFELSEIKRKSKAQGNLMDRAKSVSTPALDLYDVLPNEDNPICIPEDDNGYSKPKNGTKVVIDEDSGYLLPLTYKISYANAY